MGERLQFRPIELVVDGTDGAGKTPCVARLCERFRASGVDVASYAPYREREVYPLWASAPEEAARIVVEVMDRFREAHADARLLIWDRGWPTAYISTEHPPARVLFRPLPSLTLLLLGSIARTQRQARRHPHAGVWATDEARVRRYNAAYHGLEAPDGSVVLRFFPDASDTFDLNALADAAEVVLAPALRGSPRRICGQAPEQKVKRVGLVEERNEARRIDVGSGLESGDNVVDVLDR